MKTKIMKNKIKKKIVLITSDEIRHRFFKNKIYGFKKFKLSLCVYEDNKKRQSTIVKKDKSFPLEIKNHFAKRNYFEKKYLKYYKNKKIKEIKISRGELNYNKKLVKKIIRLKPDFIISYGCSLIKNELIKKFNKKFINLHLGLSPYYKGNGTNFWPIANNEFQFLGATFMLIDEGVDSGPIIHQFRPMLDVNDNIHSIGCKIILQATNDLEKILLNFKQIKPIKQKKIKYSKIYKKKDFSLQSLKNAQKNLKNIKKYLKVKNSIDYKFPIVSI